MKKNKINFIAEILIFLLYFITRLTNLIKLPVFADEAIYIRWSQIIQSVETLRFIPQTDGKQPLFMWLCIPFIKLFSNPLFASRFVSVLAGFGTILALYFLLNLIKNRKTALIACFIYILLPYTFFFDRMALADNLLSMFGLWSLYFTLLLAKKPKLDLAMILGIILGLAWLTKSPAIYFIVLSFLTILYLNPKKSYFFLISFFITFCIYNILRLGPQFHMIALRNQDYIHPLREILKHPLDPLIPHLRDVFHIFKFYLGLSFILICLPSKKNKYWFIILAWFILPLIANCAMAKVFTARYILFTIPYLIILFSLGINKYLWFLLFIPNIFLVYRLSFQPYKVNLPSIDKGYLQDWTSGWGIKDSADYLIEQAKTKNVIVGTEGFFGTLPDGLQIYTNHINQLTVFGVGNGLSQIPEKLLDAKAHGDDVYLLLNDNRHSLTGNFEIIKNIQKPDGSKLILYRIL